MVARRATDQPISRDPNDLLHIGADLGSRVGAYQDDHGFTGLIEEVRIYQGEVPPEVTGELPGAEGP